METTIIGYMLGIYWGYGGIREKNMETTVRCLGVLEPQAQKLLVGCPTYDGPFVFSSRATICRAEPKLGHNFMTNPPASHFRIAPVAALGY